MIRCPSLREYNEKLDLLLESREIEMNNRRQALTQKNVNMDRNERTENEKEFRTKFMNIVLDALTLLRWPPALEAFADPIKALLSDKNTILNVFTFLVECILPTDKLTSNTIQLNNNNDDISESNIKISDFKDTSTISRENLKKKKSSTKFLTKNDDSDISIIEDFKFLGTFNPVKSMSDISVETNSLLGKNSPSVFRYPNDATNNSCKKCYNNPGFMESFEILQYQNEVLSRQVKTLHENMHKREQLELYTSSLLLDLNLTLDEITGITNSLISKENCQTSTPKTLGSYHKATDVSHINTNSSLKTNTSIIWTQLRSKILDLRSQWEETMQNARKILLAEVKVLENSKEFIEFSPSNRQAKSTRGNVAGSTNYASHKPSSILLNQILGVNPVFTSDNEITTHQGVGLNISRIHTIQRDLVTFVDSAYEICQSMEKDKLANENNREIIEKMKHSAQSLLLHVSYLAPIVPLSLDHPYSSSLTGIDLLMDEIVTLSTNPKISKSIIHKLQSAAERSKTEQIAMARCLFNKDKEHKLQRLQTSEVLPTIKIIEEDIKLKIAAFTNEIKNILHSVQILNNAFRKAEDARIKDNIEKKIVSPLVSIANGSLGVDMANFMNTFKASAGELCEFESRLKSMVLNLKLVEKTVQLSK
jgi:hypothetical protein